MNYHGVGAILYIYTVLNMPNWENRIFFTMDMNYVFHGTALLPINNIVNRPVQIILVPN